MITIRDIIYLCKMGQLKNCRFISGDSSNVSIQVDENGCAFFDQPSEKQNNTKLLELSEEEIERIDAENDYYSQELWDSMRANCQKEQESSQKAMAPPRKASNPS